MSDSDTLTLAGLREAIADVNRRFPPPDVWVYGIDAGFYGGPIGVSRAEAGRLIAAGWAYVEGPTGRVYWTPRARVVVYELIHSWKGGPS